MKFVWLSLVCLATWLFLTIFVFLVSDEQQWLASSVGCAICLVPALGTMALLDVMGKRSSIEALGSVLVAPLVRLISVTILGVLACIIVPGLKENPLRFIVWTSVFYLLTLVVETALLLPKKRLAANPASTDSPQS